MRNQITTTRLLASLVVPLLFACGAENSGGNGGLVQIPTCDTAGQVLSTDSTGQFVCRALPAGALVLPSCHKYSEALTSDGTNVTCTNRNVESAEQTKALNDLETSEKLINEYTTRIGNLKNGPGARVRFCGKSAAKTKGHFTSGGAHGIAAAIAICNQAPGCSDAGGKARMCSVYDMYYSAASGALTDAMDVEPSWVYQASWSQEFTGVSSPTSKKDAGSGQSDNCGSYSYDTGDRNWFGTAVEWKVGVSGQRALHFYTGPGTVGLAGSTTVNPTNTHSMPCGNSLFIACCK